MKEKLISVVIIHYGEKALLMRCLESVKKQSYKNLDIIIVNNADYKLNESIIHPMACRIINNKKNNYYAKSANQGISKSDGEYILVLNNDVQLDKKFIDVCSKSIELDSKIGIVSGKILDNSGMYIDSTGQYLSRYRKPTERGYKQLDKAQFEEDSYIFGVCGAAAFYKKEMLEDIKLDDEYFDEDYSMFYEDLDLNWRAQKSGWKAYYNPKAIAYHGRGNSAKKKYKNIKSRFYLFYLSDELKFHVIKNRYMTIIKNEELKDFLLNLFWIISYDLLLWCFVVVSSPKLIIKILFNLEFLKVAFKKRKLIKNTTTKK